MIRPADIRPTSTAIADRWCAVLIACAVAAVAGCRVAPPRYQTTWERATSRCHLPVVPYCHGYSPTTWSRWPEGCESHDYVVVEEIAQPMPQPPGVEATVDPSRLAPPGGEIFEVPPSPESPAGPGLESPDRQGEPQSSRRRAAPTREKAAKSAKQRSKPARRADEPASWTAHLRRYADEVTQIR